VFERIIIKLVTISFSRSRIVLTEGNYRYMKFTDGMWLIRPGAELKYPAEAYEIRTTADSLTALAPTAHIGHRGATLGGPVLTVRLSSPMPDVVCVRIDHFTGAGQHGPEFKLSQAKGHTVAVVDADDTASITSGKLTASIRKKDGWELAFSTAGRSLTKSEPRGIGYARMDDGKTYLHEQLLLDVGECVYGFGERFTAFVKNGQSIETWNKDGGAGTDQAYKSVPFFMTNRGYGVFVNHPGNVEFEIGTEKASKAHFSVPGESLEYYVILGPTPKEVLAKYTALTGRPALPPPWSFGLWLTTSFTTSYDEATVTSFLDGMAERDLPLHVFHFDCFWMREFRWCDFDWDARTFPNPRAMLKRLKERGLKICVWINSYIAQESRLFAEGVKGGYFLKRFDGTVWQSDQWQPGMAIVDFTNPAACKWYAGYLKSLLDDGVDCFKTDFGERIPTDVVYFDGSDPEKAHNYYTYLYNQTVFDLLVRERGDGEATLFARSATAGGQKFPVHWGGDCWSTFNAMAESLRGGLSLCLSGFGFWSHDIGGFEGTPPAAIYKRWVAFGLLSSHSRLHGSSSYRVPWLYDEEAVDVLRHFTKLKCSLMPYLFGAAVEAHETGTPMMRAMMLEFPGDPAMDYLDRQYMLGESLLVAPVFHEDGQVQYFVPPGRWTEFFTGEAIVGPRWVRETHDYLSIPLLVRPNTILPVGAHDDKPDYEYAEGVRLRIYELEEGRTAKTVVPNQAGKPALTVTAKRSGQTIAIAASGRAKGWTIQLAGISTVASVDGGTAEPDLHGAIVHPKDGATTIKVTVG
jgi:alpha-D-xyloside xylohydrolase